MIGCLATPPKPPGKTAYAIITLYGTRRIGAICYFFGFGTFSTQPGYIRFGLLI